MAEPIAAWHADHVNFARLLNLLERELIAFHAGEKPDYALMLASVYYLRHTRTACTIPARTWRSPASSRVTPRCSYRSPGDCRSIA